MAKVPSFLGGWRLVFVTSLAIALSSAVVVALHPGDVDAVRSVIRFTARTSLALFLLAFTADASFTLLPNALTRWQRTNRRYLGVSFAASHAVHAAAIVSFARMSPSQLGHATTAATFLFGGLGYLFIILLTATSFDRVVELIGRRRWKMLHTVGVHYLWIQLMISFGTRVPQQPAYGLFVAALVIALGVRIAAAARARSASWTTP